jgi:peptidoglycan/LPS O-acetylase OafA/YrhL
MDAGAGVGIQRPTPGGVGGDSPRDGRAPAIGARSTRVHWLDWLRVAAILAVVVYHGFRAFDTSDWHVKNAETSELIRAAMVFFESFGLGLLFLLAGAGAWYALRKRTWRTFIGERTRRLLVPFVAGVAILSPIQGFIEATHKGTYSGSFIGFVGPWFGDVARWVAEQGFSPSPFGAGYHLWFIGFLFAFSLIGLPMIAAMAGDRGRAAMDGLARRAGRLGASLAFAAPIALLLMIFMPLGSDEHDWGEFGWFFGYYLVGCVLASDERFMAAIRRDLAIALVVGVVTTAMLVSLDFGRWISTLAERGFDWTYPAMFGLFGIEGWAWTIVVLGVGMRAAALQRPVPGHLGEAVLPIYIVHQPVILGIAFFVVQWPLGIVPKAAIVLSASLVLTFLLVELALRIPVIRVLLGVRARPTVPTQTIRGPSAGIPIRSSPGAPRGADHAQPR